MAQTGEFRERNLQKQPEEARAAAERAAVVTWDEPWRLTSEIRDRRRQLEARRLAQLDRDIADAEADVAVAEASLTEEQARVARLQDLLEEQRAIHVRNYEVKQARIDAERATRAAEKRADYQTRRLERLGTRSGDSRNGRPVRVEVDDGAWATLRRESLRTGTTLMWRLGHLVCCELTALAEGEVLGRPSSRRRRSQGEGDPVPRRRFIRIAIEDDAWLNFRTAALDLGISASRYLGELVEVAAHQVDWRAAPSSGADAGGSAAPSGLRAASGSSAGSSSTRSVPGRGDAPR